MARRFLANNAKDPDVQTTAAACSTGDHEGTGPKPTATDTVTVNYRGTLIDGTSSTVPISWSTGHFRRSIGVIPGWTEGLQYMSVGSTYMFYIPSSLGYGAQRRRDQAPANSTLIFQVDLDQPLQAEIGYHSS